MRRTIVVALLMIGPVSLAGCETVTYSEGPADYALRPDYRDDDRVPPPIRYPDRYDRYDRYSEYRDPYIRRPPPPVRPYPLYDRYRDYDDGY
ncbi:hypothetical protein [Aureimonas psammosilenae]|uniref:hypothetical protein n=1 Tax=Aureimonas psammosilenae TaxID=2495496 RepID=UPI0012612BE8|nr:hypothetical protein [Aureimonas psammosilenae]